MKTSLNAIAALLPRREELGYWTLTFLALLLGAKLGQFLYTDLGTAPALFWPPAGIALAMLFLYGYRMWSAIALAAFVAAISAGLSWPLILAATLGNTIQPLMGAYLFKTIHFRPTVSQLRDTLLLIVVALVVTTIAPTVSLLVRAALSELPADPAELWRVIWSGGILSVLVLTPLIIYFAQDMRIKVERMLEHLIAFIVLAGITYTIFWTSIGRIGGIPLVYLLLVPHFWISLRFHPRSISLALFVTSVIAISGALIHPPNTIPYGQWLFQTQLLLEIFAGIFLILGSVIEERRAVARELKEHVEQLENAITKISEQDAAKSDFLATLAHELRNPLAPVLSTLELLRLKRAGNEESVLIEGAEQRLHMMGRLLDDLLDISRISEKRLQLKKDYVALQDIARRSIDGAKPLMDKYGHSLTVSLPHEEVLLYADPIRIEQVIVNVLNNAAKYTNPSGQIELAAITNSDAIEIRIRDNGTGIEPSMLGRIFEPFLQIASTKYGTSGVGIGLALAKELVEMHEGTIRAESKGLGTGSTFVIRFPAAKSPAQKALPLSPRTNIQPIQPLKILVVDDNQAGTDALGRLLTFRGHTTLLAYSGVSGLRIALTEDPDVILLDIGLPDLDGYEVAKRLRTHGSRAFIIALTGYGQEEDKRKSLAAGCNAHLTKPVGLRDIEAVLEART